MEKDEKKVLKWLLLSAELEKIMEKRSNGYSRWQTKETGNPLIFWDNCTCLAAPDLRRITGKQPNT